MILTCEHSKGVNVSGNFKMYSDSKILLGDGQVNGPTGDKVNRAGWISSSEKDVSN